MDGWTGLFRKRRKKEVTRQPAMRSRVAIQDLCNILRNRGKIGNQLGTYLFFRSASVQSRDTSRAVQSE